MSRVVEGDCSGSSGLPEGFEGGIAMAAGFWGDLLSR